MRNIYKISMIAAAALAVSACGSKTETNIDNATITDLNATDDMGTMTDNMTSIDSAGTTNMDAGMANDTALTNDMAGNSTVIANETAANTTNAM